MVHSVSAVVSVVGSQARYVIETVRLKTRLVRLENKLSYRLLQKEDTSIFGVTTLEEIVHNLGGTHDAEQRSGISGKNLMGRREVNDIGKERSLKEIQGS